MKYKAISMALFVIGLGTCLGSFWWVGLSQSIDFATHEYWVNLIRQEGHWDFGYPPLAHALAAVVGSLFGSSVVGLNIVSILCLIVLAASVAYLLKQTGFVSFVATSVVLFFFYFVVRKVPLLGYEVVRNYFYAQLVATAYFMVALIAFSRLHAKVRDQVGFSVLVVLVGSFIYPIPVLIYFLATFVLLVLRLIENKGRELLYALVYFTATILVFLWSPYTESMIRIAANNGGLTVFPFSNEGSDLNLLGFGFIGLMFLLSGIMALSSLRVQGAFIRVPFFPLINAVTLATSGLAVAQSVLLVLGFSNPYAVKKYFFILDTFSLMELSLIGTYFVTRFFKRPASSAHAKGRWMSFSVALVPVFAWIFLFSAKYLDIRPLLDYQSRTVGILNQEGAKIKGSEIVARLPLPPVYNMILSTNQLGTSLGTAAQYCYLNNSVQLATYTGKVLAVKGNNGFKLTAIGADLEVLDYGKFQESTAKLNLEYFSQIYDAVAKVSKESGSEVNINPHYLEGHQYLDDQFEFFSEEESRSAPRGVWVGPWPSLDDRGACFAIGVKGVYADFSEIIQKYRGSALQTLFPYPKPFVPGIESDSGELLMVFRR